MPTQDSVYSEGYKDGRRDAERNAERALGVDGYVVVPRHLLNEAEIQRAADIAKIESLLVEPLTEVACHFNAAIYAAVAALRDCDCKCHESVYYECDRPCPDPSVEAVGPTREDTKP